MDRQAGQAPQIRELLDDAKGNYFDVIVVHSLDRWARNISVTLDSFRTLSESGVTFVSIQEQIDYTSPEGRLFLVMLGAFAQYFSDALARHTTKGLKERARRGLYNGEPSFGYDRCTESCKDIRDMVDVTRWKSRLKPWRDCSPSTLAEAGAFPSWRIG